MKNYKLILACVVIVFVGCSEFVPFQPNPYEYEHWSAAGVSQLDIKKAMLECGYPSPFSINDRELNLFPSSNEVAFMIRCMEKSGFVYGGGYKFCNGFRELPACQADALVPRRESSRRINSLFCKKYLSADACTP